MIVHMGEFILKQLGGISVYEAPSLSTFSNVTHGFTTRGGGVSDSGYASLNLGAGSGDDPSLVAENRRRLSESIGVHAGGLRFARQVHGAETAVLVDEITGADEPISGVDALATSQMGLTLFVLSADCTVVLLYAPRERAIAAVHAGWKGTVAGVAASAVRTLSESFESDPATMIAAVGPAIGPCCYEVDAPVIDAVNDAFGDYATALLKPGRDGHAYLDLWEANRRQLVRTGLSEDMISVAGLCTHCHSEQFFSQRRDGLATGRFGAFISLS
jgi:polyphenol oxidase